MQVLCALVIGSLITEVLSVCVKPLHLETGNGTIQYSGISGKESCTWIFPHHKKENSSAIILHLKSIRMFYRSRTSYLTCSGTLNIPGKGSVCSRNKPYCRIYTTTNSRCTLAQLQTHSYQECDGFMWHTMPKLPREITFVAEKRVQKSFTLDYLIINCAQSTRPLTTSQSGTTLVENSTYHVTTKNESMKTLQDALLQRVIDDSNDTKPAPRNVTGFPSDQGGFDASSFITAIAVLCILLVISGFVILKAYSRYRGQSSRKANNTVILNLPAAEQETTEPIYATIGQSRISISVTDSREMTMNVIYGDMQAEGEQSLQIPLTNSRTERVENLYSVIRRKSSVQSDVAQLNN